MNLNINKSLDLKSLQEICGQRHLLKIQGYNRPNTESGEFYKTNDFKQIHYIKKWTHILKEIYYPNAI